MPEYTFEEEVEPYGAIEPLVPCTEQIKSVSITLDHEFTGVVSAMCGDTLSIDTWFEQSQEIVLEFDPILPKRGDLSLYFQGTFDSGGATALVVIETK